MNSFSESEIRNFFVFAGDVAHFVLRDGGTSAILYFGSEQERKTAAHHLNNASFKGTG